MKRPFVLAMILLAFTPVTLSSAQIVPPTSPTEPTAASFLAPDAAPVNPNASPGARALLRYLDSISGHYTLTGQHNFVNAGSRWTDRIYDLTGKYPGLFGTDFGQLVVDVPAVRGEDTMSADKRSNARKEGTHDYMLG